MRRLVLVTLLVAIVPATARAQPSLSPIVVVEPPPVKSPSKALFYGLMGVLGGYALGMTAGSMMEDSPEIALPLAVAGGALYLVGPSFGHVYAGEWGRATAFTLGRVAGAAIIAYGVSVIGDDDGLVSTDGLGFMLLGGLVVFGVTIWDLVDTPHAARRANRRRVAATPTGLALSF
jgi:hypothetical protein